MACNDRRGPAMRCVRRAYGGAVLAAALLSYAAPTLADQPIRVTTTQAVLRSLVEAVGGERVKVESIAAPRFDPHFIEPKPSDIVRLGRSDFFVHMGLDLELWRGPLVEAAVNRRLLPGGAGEIDCSRGIRLLEVPTRSISRAEGDIHLYGNPHYWLDPENAARVAAHIAERLGEFSPADERLFAERLRVFQDDLGRRTKEWRAALAPYRDARLAAYHNSWPYIAQAFGLRIDLFLEPKPGIPPSGAHLEQVVAEMKKDGVRVVVIEPFQPRRQADSVAEKAGARVVELWQNPEPGMGYAGMLERDVRALLEALAASGGGGR